MIPKKPTTNVLVVLLDCGSVIGPNRRDLKVLINYKARQGLPIQSCAQMYRAE